MSAAVVTLFAVVDDEPVQPEKKLGWYCPGCGEAHLIPISGNKGWAWDGSLDRPTISPSVLVRWTKGSDHTPVVCHSFVRAGVVDFLGDCTHAMAGQSVPMLPANADPFGDHS